MALIITPIKATTLNIVDRNFGHLYQVTMIYTKRLLSLLDTKPSRKMTNFYCLIIG